MFEQVCIPVGCVPTASLGVSGGCGGGVGGVHCPHPRPHTPSARVHVLLQTPFTFRPSACWDTPPVDRMTNACEIIIFTSRLISVLFPVYWERLRNCLYVLGCGITLNMLGNFTMYSALSQGRRSMFDVRSINIFISV